MNTTFIISIETLNDLLQACGYLLGESIIQTPNYRVSVLVPAGQTTTINFALPSGFVCTKRSPLLFQSDYYSKNILIRVYRDGNLITPSPVPLDHPFEIDFGMYYVKKRNVVIEITNNESIDVNVTFQVIPLIISYNFFREIYEPILLKMYNVLRSVAL